GPVLAAQMGYLPGTLWLLAGVVLAGAVQDFMVLFSSPRRNATTARQNAPMIPRITQGMCLNIFLVSIV
ncbi:carbon starvation CstA family protein, partial [Escherichia coli]|uniref:carbon starvation CstA family protein n=1 Tax=Escherichia coli TaxID=562 RepID=UPI003EE2C838